MSLPPEFGDLPDDALKARMTRLAGDRELTAPEFRPAVEAELNLLRAELVDRLRRKHNDGESVV